MIERESTVEEVQKLLESQRLGVLATENRGKPHTSLVAFAHSDNLGRVVFCTNTASRKYTNILENPSVGMLIDDRKNDMFDFKDAIALSVIGKAREPEGEERKELLEKFMTKHPYLDDFAISPTTALLVIDVETYNLVSHFQNVRELRIDG